jgi:hypothetical protein
VLAREHPPGAAKPDGDFVGDHQDVVFRAQISHLAQEASRMHDHPRRALDDGLDAHRGDARAVLLEDEFQLP